MEQALILPECEVFQATPIEVYRKYWQDDDIWGVIKSYPPFIRRGFEKLKEAIHEYIANGYSDGIHRQYRFDEHFLKEFCHSISGTECLEKSFTRARGYIYKFGLEWCKLKILQYYRKFQKIPPAENGFFAYFKRDCKKGVLKQYGISCWGDLLEISLQDHTFFQRDRQNLTGHEGLQRAKIFLQKQYKTNGKIPMSCDNGCKLIANAVRRNFWKDYGITTWGDLIFEVFGYIKGTVNLWKGEGGLNRTINYIKEFFNEHGKLPSTNSIHYSSIYNSISSKIWSKYGINNWDDLTLKACGIVELKKKRKRMKKRMKWKGIEGLNRAKNEFKKYFNTHSKLPVISMFPSIGQATKKGYWKEYNIHSWNDLLRDTFGKVNVVQRAWIGQEGLEITKKELEKHFIVHRKLPISRLFLTDYKMIRKGYWKEYNIHSWNDLLRDTFGKLNKEHETWMGRGGLDRAKKIIKYKIKHGKYNKANKHKIARIKRALIRKYWAEFGIFTWEDLIQYVLNDSH